MGKLFLLFTVVPFLELYLLLVIGRIFGALPTILLVVVTGFIGAWLARSEGLRVVRHWQAALAEGRVPEEGVLGGLLVLVGGVLLITPGVATDVVGFLLLIPSTRLVLVDFLQRRLERKIREGSIHVVTYTRGAPAEQRGRSREVIDIEGEEVTDEPEGEPSRPELREGESG